jgi:hypothetical protein
MRRGRKSAKNGIPTCGTFAETRGNPKTDKQGRMLAGRVFLMTNFLNFYSKQSITSARTSAASKPTRGDTDRANSPLNYGRTLSVPSSTTATARPSTPKHSSRWSKDRTPSSASPAGTFPTATPRSSHNRTPWFPTGRRHLPPHQDRFLVGRHSLREARHCLRAAREDRRHHLHPETALSSNRKSSSSPSATRTAYCSTPIAKSRTGAMHRRASTWSACRGKSSNGDGPRPR